MKDSKEVAILKLARIIIQVANLAEDKEDENKNISMNDIFVKATEILKTDTIEEYILNTLNFPKNDDLKEIAKELIFDYGFYQDGSLKEDYVLQKLSHMHVAHDLKNLRK